MNESSDSQAKGGRFVGAVVILACICLGSGAGVGILYWSMKGKIEEKAQSVFHEALAEVLGEADSYDAVNADEADEAKRVYVNEAGGRVLYAGTGEAQGYQSRIKVLVSVEAPKPNKPVGDDPLIHRMAVVSSQETPGLGENIKLVEKDVSIWAKAAGKEPADAEPKRPWFQEQFTGKRLSDLVVETASDTDGIRAVTGATITSKAATEAVQKAVKHIIEATAEAYGQ